jgi:hypothetical protein
VKPITCFFIPVIQEKYEKIIKDIFKDCETEMKKISTHSVPESVKEIIGQSEQKSSESINEMENECEFQEVSDLKACRDENRKKLIQKLKEDLRELKTELEKHNYKVKQRHDKAFKALQEEYNKKLEAMKQQYGVNPEDVVKKCEEKLKQLRKEYERMLDYAGQQNKSDANITKTRDTENMSDLPN